MAALSGFRDKTVWVTGASSGIGRALAFAFAAAGARCILSARNAEQLEACRAEIADRHGTDALVLPLDLEAPATFPDTVRAAVSWRGGVDCLVNNAGLGMRTLALETPLEMDRRIMEVNYFGPIALTKALVPHMIARGGGRVAAITSVMGKFGACRRSAYAASKHALHGFFESLRAELWEKNIRVSLICPGYVRTDISRRALRSDGTAHGQMDAGQEKGLAPEVCAGRILRALEQGRDEAYIGGLEVGGIYLFRLFPGLMRRILRGKDISG